MTFCNIGFNFSDSQRETIGKCQGKKLLRPSDFADIEGARVTPSRLEAPANWSKLGEGFNLLLVRFALRAEEVLAPFPGSVAEWFENWLARQQTLGQCFTLEQEQWLELIVEHIATSLSIEPQDFSLSPFSQRGGRGRAYQVFGNDLPKLLEEMNEVLAA